MTQRPPSGAPPASPTGEPRVPLPLSVRARWAGRAALGGLLVDAGDLASSGAPSWLALLLGAALGIGLAPRLAPWLPPGRGIAATRGRLLCGLLAAVYCALPTTALMPLATLLAASAGFALPRDEAQREAREEAARDGD